MWQCCHHLIEEEKYNYDLDMCFISGGQQDIHNQNDLPQTSDHAVVLCKSGPAGFVRKVDRKNGQVWQVDNSESPMVDTEVRTM